MTDTAPYDDRLFTLMQEMASADEMYAPTSFWGPGVRSLLSDYFKLGLEKFKRWPSSHSWFYSVYGDRFSKAQIEMLATHVQESMNLKMQPSRLNALLNGALEARRDFDVARSAWDQSRWPMDFSFGESGHGSSPQGFHLAGPDGPVFGRPFLNYLLVLAALSKHVEEVPQSFLEIGGGFGVLGEIVIKSNAAASYVDVDLPPLCVVANYYLDHAIPEGDTLTIPPWQIGSLDRSADVFVNSYSFQEMEPHVVTNYASHVERIGPKYVVSLNSVGGKRRADPDKPEAGGAVEPVTSEFIVRTFSDLGYRLCGRYQDPLVRSAAEAVVMIKR